MGLELNQVTGTVGGTVATDTVGDHFQVVKTAFGGAGVVTRVSSSTPLPVTGTTDAPLPATIVSGSVNITALAGSVNVGILTGGSVNVGVLTGGSINVGGSVTTQVTAGSMNVRPIGTVTQPVYITGSVSVPGTVTVVGSVTTSATIGTIDTLGSGNVFITGGSVTTQVTMGTIPALLGTSQVAGSVSIIGGTVGVNVTGGALTGTSPVSGSVSIINGSVNVGVLTGGSINVGGSVTTQFTAGSANVAITGTLPGPVRNTLAIVQAGSADKVLGSAGGTGDYLSHLTIVMGSTASGTVSIADNLRGTHIVFGSGQSNVPYTVAVLAHSKFGPWRVSAGTGVTVMATGVFTD